MSKIFSIFNGIKSFFSGFVTQILGGIVVALLLLCAYFYVGNSIKEGKISNLQHDIQELDNKRQILESQLANCKLQYTAEVEAKELQQSIIDRLNNNEQDTLKEISKFTCQPGDNKNEQINLNDSLPDDLVRVLSEHCRNSKGKACTNP